MSAWNYFMFLQKVESDFSDKPDFGKCTDRNTTDHFVNKMQKSVTACNTTMGLQVDAWLPQNLDLVQASR